MRDIEGIEQVMERLRPHMPEILENFERENARFKALMSQDHDLLGRVLKCHLVVEHYLERFLSSHYGIEDLGEAKLTFHQKAKLLPDQASASAFVKPGILRLNSIRNQFGHTLRPVLSFNDLGAMNDVLTIARAGARSSEPVEAIEAFTTVACTWLIVPPKHLQQAFTEAFANVRVHAP